METKVLPRSNRRYQLPERGLVLPTTISLPPATVSRQTLIDFGRGLGLNIPVSLNREALLARIRTDLSDLGYRSLGDNVVARDQPLQLIYLNEAGRGPSDDIHLPETVPTSTFATRESILQFIREHQLTNQIRTGQGRLKGDLARDLREFLTDQGYAIDPRGNFIRKGGLVIAGGYEFIDLVSPEVYLSFLRSNRPVPVTQEDLIRLNTPLASVVARMTRRRWPTFPDFIADFSQALGVDPELATMVALLGRLSRESNLVLLELLQSLGSTRLPARIDDRLNILLEYFRAKLQLVPRHYSPREHFQGDALTTMSFVEALNGGYRFGVEQYQQEIDDLLDQKVVPPSQRQLLVDLIQQYPEMFPVMRLYNSNGSTMTVALLRLYYTDSPTEVQLLYAFAVNYPLILPESDEKKARRQQLSKLPRPYLESLYGIYRVADLEIILDTPPHPLELYLLAIRQLNVDQLPSLVAGFGMVVPEHLLTREIRTYILSWMPQYRRIITRVPPVPNLTEAISGQPESVEQLIQQLNIYSDQEIITYFGYTGGFDTRNALIENIFRTISEMGFIVYKEIDPERTINTETMMLTEVNELTSPYLVFGTAFSYRVHELDELIQAWSEPGRFRRIDGDGTYTIAQVSRLQSLLPLMKSMNGQLSTKVDQLLERIREGILSTMRRSAEVDEVLRDLRDASESVRKLVREIFYKIFYAGMYMRRWRGPGNRYPVQSYETRGEGNPEPKVALVLGELYEMLNELRRQDERLIQDLERAPEIQYQARADAVVVLSQPLLATVKDVFGGKLCIRQASRRLVISAHYYLAVGFREVVADFSPYDVESIS